MGECMLHFDVAVLVAVRPYGKMGLYASAHATRRRDWQRQRGGGAGGGSASSELCGTDGPRASLRGDGGVRMERGGGPGKVLGEERSESRARTAPRRRPSLDGDTHQSR